MSGKCPECEGHFKDKSHCPYCQEPLTPDYQPALKPELGWCKCGQEATAAMEYAGHRIALCEACWQKGTRKLLSDLQKRRGNRHV